MFSRNLLSLGKAMGSLVDMLSQCVRIVFFTRHRVDLDIELILDPCFVILVDNVTSKLILQ